MNEHRLCKIVWNSEGWVKPIVRNWTHKHLQNKNVGYRQKHGFVYEAWLFIPRYIVSGYQSGMYCRRIILDGWTKFRS